MELKTDCIYYSYVFKLTADLRHYVLTEFKPIDNDIAVAVSGLLSFSKIQDISTGGVNLHQPHDSIHFRFSCQSFKCKTTLDAYQCTASSVIYITAHFPFIQKVRLIIRRHPTK